MTFDPEVILRACGPGDVAEAERCVVAADGFLAQGDKELAASALDRAYGILPRDPHIARQRAGILAELSVVEHGLVFRYVPAGTFVMGSPHADPDERPPHARRTRAFWMAEVPTTWAAFCDVLEWSPPPKGWPPPSDPALAAGADRMIPFGLHESNKLRVQYCETETAAAWDWHAHAATNPNIASLYGAPPRENPSRPLAYDTKPMIAVSADDAEFLGIYMSSGSVRYALPSEAQWEKAARGGLIGCRWSWGDDPPTPAVCDFDRFGDFRLRAPRLLPPNGYGLYGMCGGVWEWTADPYDALAYARHASLIELPPLDDSNARATRVIRGGSWTDCADAVTVSFRMSRVQRSWRAGSGPDARSTPNVGFRLVRLRT